MADIASVFHWPLSEMSVMDPWELALWWKRARDRAPPN
ncbi:MAG: GpE family phage tail protein [Rhodobacteraceae bacterium]|nr:GpE family phage tail protein [Paracoccaceae bacterium]